MQCVRGFGLMLLTVGVSLGPRVALAGGHGGGGGGGHGGGGGGGFHGGGGGGGGFHGGGSVGGGFHGGGSGGGGFHGGGPVGGGFHGGGPVGGGYHPAPPSFHAGGGFHPAPPSFHAGGGYHPAPPSVRPGGGFRPGGVPGGGFRAGAPGVARPGFTPGYRTMPYRAGAMPYRAGAMARPFVQRPWRFGGQSVMHTYRPYGWGGRPYYAFAPGRRFYPGFYRSFYTPWARPIAYRWGWYGAPWYRSYGYYFQPYASYYSPAWWLTDWLIADMLAAQYAEAAAAPTQYAAPLQQEQAAPMDDEVKEQLRREVEAAAQAQQAQQSIDIGTALQDPSHIYAVSQAVGVTDVASNAACMVTTGDLLRVAEPVSQGAQAATMVVVSAKRGSCPVGSRVLVSLGDLQGFLNDFSERVEQGMGQMQQSQPSGTPEEGESQEMPPQ